MGATHPFMVLPGASRSQRTEGLGGEISLKVSGRDTDGVWTLFETLTLPHVGPRRTSTAGKMNGSMS